MISLSITFFIYSRILFSVTFICFTLNDRLLPNKNFESFYAIDWLQCIKACQNSPSCISYNYEVYNDKSCFLNECGFRDRCEVLRNLVESPGAIFHQLKKASNETLCNHSKFTDELPINNSEKRESPDVEINPVKCSYEKNISHSNEGENDDKDDRDGEDDEEDHKDDDKDKEDDKDDDKSDEDDDKYDDKDVEENDKDDDKSGDDDKYDDKDDEDDDKDGEDDENDDEDYEDGKDNDKGDEENDKDGDIDNKDGEKDDKEDGEEDDEEDDKNDDEKDDEDD